MEKNIIVQRLEEIIGTDSLAFLSGEITNCGTELCDLTGERGSVYGIAIKINSEEKKQKIFENLKRIPRMTTTISVSDWKTIGDDFYPLYWGKDINMGIRIHSHTKIMKSTATLQLSKKECLKNEIIIYGAMPCRLYEEKERMLKTKYPDILKTKKGQKTN